MERIINGIEVYSDLELGIHCYVIKSLSDELKALIRDNLVKICKGQIKAEAMSEVYTYRNTILRLKDRLQGQRTGDTRKLKGMVAEFLCHLLIVELNQQFQVVTPFFNLEEKSFTKGIDLLVADRETYEVWTTEVKSGEAGIKTSAQKNLANIKEAVRDLEGRLTSGNFEIWDNALNKITVSPGRIREEVERLVTDNLTATDRDEFTSSSTNTIFTSTVYNDLNDKIAVSDTSTYKSELDQAQRFSRTIFFSIQKETFNHLVDFFIEEADNV